MEVSHLQLDQLKDQLEDKIDATSKDIMAHVDAQISALKSDLGDHVKQDNDRFEKVNNRFNSYITHKTFALIFGASMTVIGGLLGTILQGQIRQQDELRTVLNSVQDVRSETKDVNADVSYLKGQWDTWIKN